MISISFTIPGPPVPAGRPRVFSNDRNGKRLPKTRAITPAKTINYERHAGMVALAARSRCPAWRLDAVYQVDAVVYREANRGDWDNIGKAICDGFQRVLFNNDSQVHDGRVRMFVDRLRPRAEVTVTILEDE